MRSKTWFDFGRCAAAAALVLAAVIPAAATQAAAPAGYRPLTPSRILDTRTGLGAPQAPVGPGGVIDVQVTGVGGVPADGVAAVVFNLTGTGSTQPTFITAYPTGGEREGSNLNLVGGTDSNLVIASVGAGGNPSAAGSCGLHIRVSPDLQRAPGRNRPRCSRSSCSAS